jgi:hypothetical protein
MQTLFFRVFALAALALAAAGEGNAQLSSDPLGEQAFLFCKSRDGPKEDTHFWLQLFSSGQIGVESKSEWAKVIPVEIGQADLKWNDGNLRHEFNRYSGVMSVSSKSMLSFGRKWYDCKRVGGRMV